MDAHADQDGKETSNGHVSIIKNYGRLVGGSLAHGHQQIALSNVMPRRVLDHQRFEMEHGENFSAYMLRENPPFYMNWTKVKSRRLPMAGMTPSVLS